MIDHLTPCFNLKSMASIDTCQSGATCNVSSQARTLSSPTEEPPNTKQSCSSPISPGTKRGQKRASLVITHSAVLFLATVTESVKVFTGDLSQRLIAAGEPIANKIEGKSDLLSRLYNVIENFHFNILTFSDVNHTGQSFLGHCQHLSQCVSSTLACTFVLLHQLRLLFVCFIFHINLNIWGEAEIHKALLQMKNEISIK